VLRGAIKQGARNPVTLASLINVGVENIKLDQDTTAGDMVSLGKTFRNFDPNALQTYSLPVARAFKSGADVLELQAGQAEPILALFRGTGAADEDGGLSPAAIAVQVINASGTQNQAADTSELLASVGFKMSPPSSAAPIARTEVRYPSGMEAQAALVARHLYADAALVPDMDVSQVTVVTGPDFRSALLDARPAEDFPVPTSSTTTSTTVPGESSTSESSTTAAAPTSTTTEPTGYVPEGTDADGKACG
jgi:hypothetical protein